MLVPRYVHGKVYALGAHRWAAVGGVLEDVVHAVNRALNNQGARHALREDEMCAIGARVALCVC